MPHVAVAENATLDWICSAERSWVVGLYHVAAVCNFAHTPTCWGLDGARPRE